MAPLTAYRLDPSTVHRVGSGLRRPECVLAEPDGTLWASDTRAAACRIDADGSQHLVGSPCGTPNGLALSRDGSLYVADIEDGRVLRISPDGREEVVLAGIDGEPLGSPNFPYIDNSDRLWVTVSTRTQPRSAAKDTPVADGFIMRLDD